LPVWFDVDVNVPVSTGGPVDKPSDLVQILQCDSKLSSDCGQNGRC